VFVKRLITTYLWARDGPLWRRGIESIEQNLFAECRKTKYIEENQLYAEGIKLFILTNFSSPFYPQKQ